MLHLAYSIRQFTHFTIEPTPLHIHVSYRRLPKQRRKRKPHAHSGLGPLINYFHPALHQHAHFQHIISDADCTRSVASCEFRILIYARLSNANLPACQRCCFQWHSSVNELLQAIRVTQEFRASKLALGHEMSFLICASKLHAKFLFLFKDFEFRTQGYTKNFWNKDEGHWRT